jgi:hypothetical protein
MTSKGTAQLLADLGVTRSLGRPQVSDDNPFSEAQFKTLKYHPGFPSRFLGREHATSYCRSFFPWYNTEHRHGGISMLTPHDVHYGRAPAILAQRQRTLDAAWPFILNDSFEASRRPLRFLKRSGSIHPRHRRQEELLPKYRIRVSHRR